MPSYCAVAECTQSLYVRKGKDKNTNLILHRFPSSTKKLDICKEWKMKCRREDEFNTETSYICSDHFTFEDYERDLKAELMGCAPKKVLKHSAIPSRNLPSAKKHNKSVGARKKRMKMKMQEHEQHITVEEILAERQVNDSQLDTVSQEEITPTLSIHDSGVFMESTPRRKRTRIQHSSIIIRKFSRRNDEMLKRYTCTQKTASMLKQKNIFLRNELKRITKEKNAADLKLRQLQRMQEKESVNKRKESEKIKVLENFFTNNEMKLLAGDQTRVRWTNEEITNAFTLRYLSYKAYIHLRNKRHFPLPSISSLQKWASALDMRNGVLEKVIYMMKLIGDGMDNFSKLTVLQFDEFKVKSVLEYDRKHDEVLGPYNQAQVIMARGLTDKWKQPIYIGFDQKITKELLFDIIRRLLEIGYKVVATVSDCGASNVGLWRVLNINYENPGFYVPGVNQQIVYFPDVPHLLKLIRNWLLNTGFILSGDRLVTQEPIKNLIKLNKTELRPCPKVSDTHITVTSAERQNVRIAAQLMSHTVASALNFYQDKLENEPSTTQNTAYFIELINNWFDIMNVRIPGQQATKYKTPFGLHEEQTALLNEVYNVVENLKCINKSKIQIFQKGVLMGINSLKILWKWFHEESHGKYILTAKLNQDSLENLFSQIRGRGGLNDHPTPLDALYRLRMIILAKNAGEVRNHTNTEGATEEDNFLTSNVIKELHRNDESTSYEWEDELFDEIDLAEIDEIEKINVIPLQKSEEDGLMFLAGWLARKFKDKYPDLGTYTYRLQGAEVEKAPPWISAVSHGYLTTPAPHLQRWIRNMEELFNKFYGKTIPQGRNVVRRITQTIRTATQGAEDGIPDEIIEAFARQRLFIRIKFENETSIELEKNRRNQRRLKSLAKLRKVSV